MCVFIVPMGASDRLDNPRSSFSFGESTYIAYREKFFHRKTFSKDNNSSHTIVKTQVKMSPTIALKCRLNRAMRLEGRMPFMTIPSGIRKISIGSSAELDSAHVDPTTTEDSAVQLLLSISSIVSNEVNSNGFSFDEEDNGMSKDDGSETEVSKYLLTPRGTCQSPLHTSDDNINRLRSVSIDSFSYRPQSPTVPSTKRTLGGSPLSARPVLISPTSTPVGRTRPVRRTTLKLTQKAKREHLKLPKIPHAPVLTAKVKDYKKKALSTSISKGRKLKVIGRKKFSWKNYPGKDHHSFDTYKLSPSSNPNNVISSSSTRTRSILGSQSRRVSPALSPQLYYSTEAVQQPVD